MKVTNVQQCARAGVTIVTADILTEGCREPMTLWYRFEGEEISATPSGDAFAAGLLAACMFEGEALAIDAPVSEALSSNLARAREVLSSWYAFLTPVDVTAGDVRRSRQRTTAPTALACCFSASVDSWHSLIKHQDDITHLLLVRGFDPTLDNEAVWQETRAHVAAVAARLEKRLVVCETNLRTIADKGRSNWGRRRAADTFWDECVQGSAYASVGLLLRSRIEALMIPATRAYDRLSPWGSSPLLDRFWSSDAVEVVHDGAETNRFKKIATVAACDLALDGLRACDRPGSVYNCGRCEKCLYALLALRLCGSLHRARSFPEATPISALLETVIDPAARTQYQDLLMEAFRVGDRDLAQLVKVALSRRFSFQRGVARAKQAARATVGQWLGTLGPITARTLLPSRRLTGS
jgi:hypothetical protein